MSEKFYSHDEEIFNHDSADEAAEYCIDIMDAKDIKEGHIFHIWEGEKVPNRAGDFLPHHITEQMGEYAYDNVGECADMWPNETDEQREELDLMVKKAVNEWADNHALHPDFFCISNTKKIECRGDGAGNYEFISEVT